MTRVFLDSSVIISGINSASGASWFILQLSKDKKIKAVVTDMVILEVVRNIKKKMPDARFLEFLKYLAISNFENINFTDESEVLKYSQIIHEKDVHIIASAFKSNADYLITLDKKHLLSLSDEKLPFVIISPGDFLKRLFPL
jgi:putative PIN family toxin of toxin-antitoxin system